MYSLLYIFRMISYWTPTCLPPSYLFLFSAHDPACTRRSRRQREETAQATDGGEGRMVTKVILKFKSSENKLTFV